MMLRMVSLELAATSRHHRLELSHAILQQQARYQRRCDRAAWMPRKVAHLPRGQHSREAIASRAWEAHSFGWR